MTGKKKCELLKSIRCRIAKSNNIPYQLEECSFQGECKGTCPKCEAELRELGQELERIKQSGKRVAVAGIAAAVVATSAAGCSPNRGFDFGLGTYETTGILPAPETPLPEEGKVEADPEAPPTELEGEVLKDPVVLDGDVAYVPEEGPEQQGPELSAVLALAEEAIPGYLADFSREELRRAWSIYQPAWLESRDTYTIGEQTLTLTYDGADQLIAAEIAE